MANVSFMAHGIKLWAEYKDHGEYGDHGIELLSIMTDKSDVDIEPLLGVDIIDLAYTAIDHDIAEILEYKKWKCNITFDGMDFWLGRFSSREDAIEAIKKARISIHKEFANHG